LQQRQIQILASIVKRYFKASSKDLPMDAKHLAGSSIALAQDLASSGPTQTGKTKFSRPRDQRHAKTIHGLKHGA
jgi:hypothetical protein